MGRLALCRVRHGTLRRGREVAWCRRDGSVERVKLTELYVTENLDPVAADEAGPGEIAAVAGIAEVTIGETLADPDDPRPLPVMVVDEPSLSMTIGVNGSPLAGKDGNKLTARAYFLAGLANRVLGECFCEVTFDGGAAQPVAEAFRRAIPQFQSAISHALQVTPSDSSVTNLITAARGGLAQVYVGLGQWDSAATYAAMVPTTFVYNAPYSDNSGREQNILYTETHNRPEFSVYGTYVGTFASPGDPRAPWINANRLGADGLTPHWRQRKYTTRSTPIRLASYQEAQLIIAEIQLGQTAVDVINTLHAARGLPAWTPVNVNDAAEVLSHVIDERRRELYLESQHYFDKRRFHEVATTRGVTPAQLSPNLPYTPAPGAPFPHGGFYGDQRCLPLPDVERLNNPNIQ